MSMKVGELYATLGLDDQLDKAMKKAESNFKSSAKGMDANATLGLDDLASKAAKRVEGILESMSRTYTADVEVDTSGVDDDAAEGQDSLLGMIGGWETAAAGAALGVGVVIGKSVLDGVSEAIEKGAMSDVTAASLGLGDNESARLGRLAGKIYTDNFGDSFGEVLDTLAAVLSTEDIGHWMNDDMLKASAERALTYVTMFGGDASEALLDAGVMVKKGLADSFDDAFDLMGTAMSKVSPTFRGDMMDAVGEYGDKFTQLGISGEDAFKMLLGASLAGPFALDKTGDALSELTILATDMSTATQDAFKSMGKDSHDMASRLLAGGDTARGAFDEIVDGLLGIKDPADQANTAIALFGSPLEDMGTGNIPAFLQALEDSKSGLDDWAGFMGRAGDTASDNFATGWGKVTRKLDPSSIIATFTRDGWSAAQTQISEGVSEAAALWEEYGPEVTKALETLKTEFSKWWENDGKKMVADGWDAVADAAGDWWDDNGEGVMKDVSDWWDESGSPLLGTAFSAAVSAAWDAALASLGARVRDPEVWGQAFDGAVTAMRGPLAAMDPITNAVSDWMTSATEDLPESLGGLVDSMEEFVTGSASSIWNGLSDGFTTVINWIIDRWNELEFSTPNIPGTDWGSHTFSTPDMGHIGGGGGQDWGSQQNGGLPRFANGGFVSKPTLAMIGDGQPAGKGEYVLPEDKLQAIINAAVASGRGGGDGITINGGINAGGDLSANELVDSVNARLGWALTGRFDR